MKIIKSISIALLLIALFFLFHAFYKNEKLVSFTKNNTIIYLEIANTEPGLQGDRVSGGRKSATLQTGKVIQVPLFVNIGDRVKVDTRSGEYITRV